MDLTENGIILENKQLVFFFIELNVAYVYYWATEN